MPHLQTEDLLAALQWRYATKKFDPSRRVDPATWSALEDALVLTPSSWGIQPWKFFVITDPATRHALLQHSWGQRQIVDASHVVVFAVKHPVTADDVHRHVVNTAAVQGTNIADLAGLEKMVAGFLAEPPYPLDLKAWATRQVYLALGNFMTCAALLGIDTCPMEGLDPVGYDKALGLEGTGYFTVAACPAGFRAADDKHAARPKVRFAKSEIVVSLPDKH